jgi:hypothetical protein
VVACNGHVRTLFVEGEYKALLFPKVYPIAEAF